MLLFVVEKLNVFIPKRRQLSPVFQRVLYFYATAAEGSRQRHGYRERCTHELEEPRQYEHVSISRHY